MLQLPLNKAIEQAQANPHSPFAKQLRQMIQSGQLDVAAAQQGVDLTSYGRPNLAQAITEEEEDGQNRGTGFLRGLGQSAIGAATNVAGLSNRVAQRIFPGREVFQRQQQQIERVGQVATQPQTPAEEAGKFVGEAAQFLTPGVGPAKAAGAVTRFPRIARFLGLAGRTGAVATAQEGEVNRGVAGAVAGEFLFPVARLGGVAFKKAGEISGNVFRRIAGGLGVSFDDIAANPQVAQETIERLRGGTDTVRTILREQTEQVLSDVRSYRQGLREDYGNVVEQLTEVDIKPGVFRDNVSKALDKLGVFVDETGARNLGRLEFDTPRLVNKANELIDELSNVELSGASLRTLLKKIEGSAFKTTGTDVQRLSFNAFVKDMAAGVRNAIKESTDLLEDVNKRFSDGMQLVEVMEQEFGRLKFFNLKELNNASKKMEKLLNKAGIAPDLIEDFFTRVGRDFSELQAASAVRGAFSNAPKAEAAGFNPFEIFRQITAGLLDPKDVARISTTLANVQQRVPGAAEALVSTLDQVAPAVRATLVQLIKELSGEDVDVINTDAIEPAQSLPPAQTRSGTSLDLAEQVADITGTTTREASEFLGQFPPDQQQVVVAFLQSNA